MFLTNVHRRSFCLSTSVTDQFFCGLLGWDFLDGDDGCHGDGDDGCHGATCCRMLEEILESRFMIKKAMKDYKDNAVCVL